MSPGELCSLLLRCTQSAQIHQCHAQLTAAGLLIHHHPYPTTAFYHNHLIRAHANTTTPHHSFPVFAHLLRSGVSPDSHTLPVLLKACSLIPAPPQGLSAHCVALKLGLDRHLYVTNALIHFHAVISDLAGARRLLDCGEHLDSVSHNAMISGYVRAGDLDSARHMFEEMPVRDEVSWSAMIAGYVQVGKSKDALRIFMDMQEEGLKPSPATLVSVLAACAHLSELQQGKWVHSYLKSSGIMINVFLGTALVDMYCKCGEVGLGLEVFDGMADRNLLAWTTIIRGLAMHGRGREALGLFFEMEKSGLVPDDLAFLGALCACAHAGMVDHGREIFRSMSARYHLEPKLEHYGCMVDLLARNGLLHDAMTLVERMPMKADALIWGAIMAGCRFHGKIELAEVAVKHLIELEPNNSGVYVLLANIYASLGRHENARNVRLLMQSKGVEKTPGCSTVEINGTVHQFLVGEMSHPQMHEILATLEEMEGLVRLEGYVPDKKQMSLEGGNEEQD